MREYLSYIHALVYKWLLTHTNLNFKIMQNQLYIFSFW